MSDVMASWRVAFRMNDIKESRVNILDKRYKHDFGEVPKTIMDGLVSLLDAWSYGLGTQSGAGLQDSILSSTAEATDEDGALRALSVFDLREMEESVRRQTPIPGSGNAQLKVSYLLSELSRLRRQKHEDFDECPAEDPYQRTIDEIRKEIKVRPKMILLASHAGCASVVIASHLKARLRETAPNSTRLITANLDFNQLRGSETREEVGLWVAGKVFTDNMSHFTDMNPVLLVVNMTISSQLCAEFASLVSFLDHFADLEVQLSIISSESKAPGCPSE